MSSFHLKTKASCFLALLGTAIVLTGGIGRMAFGASRHPIVYMDREHEYHAGELAIIAGEGFDRGDELTVRIIQPDGTLDLEQAVIAGDTVADAGKFTVAYVVTPTAFGVEGNHNVEVAKVFGSSEEVLARTSFMVGTHFRFGHLTWQPLGGDDS